MSRFEGKVVLVTGGTRGIGRACAEAFAREGAKVAICGRDAGKSAAAAAEIGPEVKGYGCNMASSEDVEALIKAVETDLGPIGILVNNAGITEDGLLMRMKDEQWSRVMETNLNGIFYTCRASMRSMMKQRWGRVINMSSVIGLHGQAGQANYAASKAGIIGFSKSYAQEAASRNITVNVIAPGYIGTDMTAALTEDQIKGIINNVPAKRAGRPEEIAAAVLFLASDEAAYITGAVLSVDGGLGM